MTIPTVVYVHVPGCLEHQRTAIRYVETSLAYPAMVRHSNLVVCQSGPPNESMTGLFSLLDDLVIAGHDDTGWDIGAYIKMAQLLDSVSPGQPMFCCGGSTSFRQAGWLKRLVEVWEKYGPGIYGTQSSYQFRPHLNTNGFMCLPRHLLSYPRVVADKGERYNFEHGLGAWWEQVFNAGEPAKLVTWDGEYDWPEWRKPPNISCRGDQSNCLAYFRINYDYENGSAQTKLDLEYLSDRLTNQSFQDQLCQCHPK